MRTAAQEIQITISDVISVKNALANLLCEETGLVGEMQISRVGELQDRKLKLTALLERYTRYFTKNPAALATMTPEQKAELRASNDNLQKQMKANYEKLLVARAVNQAIVTCVTGIHAKKAGNDLYNAGGNMYRNERFRAPVSVTLNRVI